MCQSTTRDHKLRFYDSFREIKVMFLKYQQFPLAVFFFFFTKLYEVVRHENYTSCSFGQISFDIEKDDATKLVDSSSHLLFNMSL